VCVCVCVGVCWVGMGVIYFVVEVEHVNALLG